MPSARALALALAVAAAAAAAAQRLVWADEFDGPAGAAPSAANWDFDVGGQGWGNEELEFFTSARANSALDGEGRLAIVARNDAASLPPNVTCWYGPCLYTSARLTTRGLVQLEFGRVEARLRLPCGQGLWPAFWLLGADIDKVGWPACGEIDVMEQVGYEPRTVHASLHGPGFGITAPAALRGDRVCGADDFHVFAADWAPDSVAFAVDGAPFANFSRAQVGGAPWPFDAPMFVLLNLAVGGDWPRAPNASTPFPATLLVDYVRAFQL
jgi:beta-glucanase (GH16 family)